MSAALILALALAPQDPAAAGGAAPAEDPATPVVESLLVIERTGRSGRSLVTTDAVLASIVDGTFRPPSEGEEVDLGEDGAATWRRIEGEEGSFRDPALSGGWALASVTVDEDVVLLLNARGHRDVFVNGVPRGGDVYDLGLTRIPVELIAGPNELLFRAGRGSLRASFDRPPAPVFFEPRDRTLPDTVRGEQTVLYAGLIVTNATRETWTDLRVVAEARSAAVDFFVNVETPLAPLPPLTSRKESINLPTFARGEDDWELLLSIRRGDEVLHTDSLELGVKSPGETHKRTFLSEIDGSVQYYSVTPASAEPTEGRRHGLLLTLHGAGVEGSGQAACYRPKPDAHVVAPTNRRPFGFDWEDWGRLDALEALRHARSVLDTDPRRQWLTGHSMGGHGTWSLGAHFPDRFAAIGPSAGWRDFWSYSGAAGEDERSAVGRMLRRAANASRTGLVLPNLAGRGVYVLHGDADATVPVREAREMRARLAEFHTDWVYYERPGAGHWWGNECMDWPPLVEFLLRRELPRSEDVREVDFVTVSPGISASSHWLTIEAQSRPLEVSRALVRVEPGEGEGADPVLRVAETSNVTRLAIDLAALARGADDGEGALVPRAPTVNLALGEALPQAVFWPADDRLSLALVDGAWSVADPLAASSKNPRRAGTFKEAFRRDVVLVHGTQGDFEEDRWAFHKARYDQETFRYRGNGALDIVADVDFRAADHADRNVVLYGRPDTNSAWTSVLGEAGAIDAGPGWVRVGERRVEGEDLCLLAIRPRSGSDVASVGVVAPSGPAGARLAWLLPYFVSGVGIPDWAVLGAELPRAGLSGVRGVGFFDADWAAGDDAAWSD